MKVFTGEEGDRETQRQKDRDIHTPAADSHCYIAETSTTLQSNYPPMPDFKHGDTHTQRNRETKRYQEIETERQGKTETEIKKERVRGTQRGAQTAATVALISFIQLLQPPPELPQGRWPAWRCFWWPGAALMRDLASSLRRAKACYGAPSIYEVQTRTLDFPPSPPPKKESACNAGRRGFNPWKKMATHSSIFAWRIPGTEEPSRLRSVGSQSHS